MFCGCVLVHMRVVWWGLSRVTVLMLGPSCLGVARCRPMPDLAKLRAAKPVKEMPGAVGWD